MAAEMALQDQAAGGGRVAATVIVNSVGIDVPEHPMADFFALDPRGVAEHSFHTPTASSSTPRPCRRRSRPCAGRTRLAGPSPETPTCTTDAPRAPGRPRPPDPGRVGDPTGSRPSAGPGPGRGDPRAAFAAVPEAGHLPHIEQPEATFAAIDGFLEKLATEQRRYRARIEECRSISARGDRIILQARHRAKNAAANRIPDTEVPSRDPTCCTIAVTRTGDRRRAGIAIPHRLSTRPRIADWDRSRSRLFAEATNQIDVRPASTIAARRDRQAGEKAMRPPTRPFASARTRTRRPVGTGCAAATSAPGRPPAPEAAISEPEPAARRGGGPRGQRRERQIHAEDEAAGRGHRHRALMTGLRRRSGSPPAVVRSFFFSTFRGVAACIRSRTNSGARRRAR